MKDQTTKRKRKDIIAGNEVSEVVTLSLGGFDQKVLIEGKCRDLPVLITLHGGPGSPLPFSVGARGMFPEFTDRFLLVCWDQLGCGINEHELDESFTIDSFVTMTEDLVKAMKSRFPGNKIYLFSMSWGSILSAKLTERDPYLVDGVVAWGQIIKNLFFCDEVMETLAASGLPAKKLEHLRGVNKDNFTMKDLQLVSSSLTKYTNAYRDKTGPKTPIMPFVIGLATSPDYSMKALKATVSNSYSRDISLWKEIFELDLSEALARVKVPYHILDGTSDVVASVKTAEELVEKSNNRLLDLETVEHSGHLSGTLAMERIFEALCKMAEQ